jgi:hypothetical protein
MISWYCIGYPKKSSVYLIYTTISLNDLMPQAAAINTKFKNLDITKSRSTPEHIPYYSLYQLITVVLCSISLAASWHYIGTAWAIVGGWFSCFFYPYYPYNVVTEYTTATLLDLLPMLLPFLG